jgi:hypothetical protein
LATGSYTLHLKVASLGDLPHQPAGVVCVTMRLFAPINVSPDRVFFGNVAQKQSAIKNVILTDRRLSEGVENQRPQPIIEQPEDKRVVFDSPKYLENGNWEMTVRLDATSDPGTIATQGAVYFEGLGQKIVVPCFARIR